MCLPKLKDYAVWLCREGAKQDHMSMSGSLGAGDKALQANMKEFEFQPVNTGVSEYSKQVKHDQTSVLTKTTQILWM